MKDAVGPPTPAVKAKRRTGAGRLWRAVILALAIFIALALGEGTIQEWLGARAGRVETTRTKEAIEGLVDAYNQNLMTVHEQGNLMVMNDLVTPAELQRIDTYMTYNSFELKKRLKSRLLDSEVIKVSLGENEESAKVRTEEKWRYWYVDKETNEAEKPELVQYKVTYSVKKTRDAWLVDKLTINSEKQL